MSIFRLQTILTRVSPLSQKTMHNFKLVVGHTTKHMKHGRSSSGSSYFNVHSLPCIICILSTTSNFTWKRNKNKLDAQQSPTLARPATPLAACIQRHPCTSYHTVTPSTECHRQSVMWSKPTKCGCHDSVP